MRSISRIVFKNFQNLKSLLERNFFLTIDRRLKLNELADSILQSTKKGKGSSSSVIMYRVIEKDNCILEPQLVDCCLNNCTKSIKYWYNDAPFKQQRRISRVYVQYTLFYKDIFPKIQIFLYISDFLIGFKIV